MSRYFFHIHDGQDHPDTVGTEFESLDRVWSEAIRACGSMLKDLGGALPRGSDWEMAVTREGGEPLFTFRFSSLEHAA